MDLDSVAEELYGLRPEDFTAARDVRVARARTAGDRVLAGKIGKLRRPSLSAWVSNLLVRERPDEVQAVLRLGEGLRQAHRDLDGTQLRELVRQQRSLIGALSREARELAAQAGHPVGESVQREVETTLHAVLADAVAAREWATGRLAKPLSAAVGFPAAAPDAVPRRAAAPAPPPGKPKQDLAKARQEADSAVRELRALEKQATAAGRDADGTKQRLDDLTDELHRAQEDHRQAQERLRTAERQVREARRRAEKAAARVERLK
ncbi:hypothetical protein AB0I00_25865 [Streptomyces sp. NPDC050803]|uniref:hypothetical protein n=1 Tax=unclassified Streptomyces TaxID=2593676 RepID=UPI003440BEA2